MGAEVLFKMIGGVGAVHHHPSPCLLGQTRLFQCGFAHVGEAHLREIVEVVFVDGNEIGTEPLEIRLVLAVAGGQHRIREKHLVPGFAEERRRVEGPQRRVRL